MINLMILHGDMLLVRQLAVTCYSNQLKNVVWYLKMGKSYQYQLSLGKSMIYQQIPSGNLT